VPPTQAPSPVPTALPSLAVAEQGFQVWCLPVDAAGLVSQTSAPPANARIGAYLDQYKAIRVIIPASTCTLAYSFNQPMPKDVTLEGYYFYGGQPWLTTSLTPAADNPNLGYLTLDHPAVVNPPLWRVDYQFKLKYNGADLRSDVVSFYKPVQRCWEGSLPDPVTLHCPESDSREPEASKHADVPPSGPDVIK
jgi:hypothetical protein